MFCLVSLIYVAMSPKIRTGDMLKKKRLHMVCRLRTKHLFVMEMDFLSFPPFFGVLFCLLHHIEFLTLGLFCIALNDYMIK